MTPVARARLAAWAGSLVSTRSRGIARVGERDWRRITYWANLAAVPVIVGLWLGIWWTQLHATLPAHDAGAYWRAGRDLGTLYEGPWNTLYAYVYSPVFAQVLSPLAALPFEWFYLVWSGIQVLALVLLCGPVLAALLLFAWMPVQALVAGGNIHLMLAVAMALGFRYPGAWSFVLLTKVTPGIGLLWFAVRREWSHLIRALAVTGAVVLVSFLVAPQLWIEWAARLIVSPDTPGGTTVYIPLPLIPRLLLAAGIIVWAARTNRPWAIFAAAFAALPVATGGGLDLLLGALPLLGWGPLARRLRSEKANREEGRVLGVGRDRHRARLVVPEVQADVVTR